MNRKISVFLLSLVLAVSCSVSVLASSFTDVKDPSWYSDGVNYVVQNGYMTGTGNTTFEPNGMVTRAQIVQILYAKEGKPLVTSINPFTDIPENKWFSAAVLWSNKNSIVAGYPDKSFHPNQPVTREQLITIMYKYASFKEFNISAEISSREKLEKYPDYGQISNYAKTSMAWALDKGILSGTNKGIEPKGTANRAQMAVIMKAFCENVENKPDTPEDDSGSHSVPSVNPVLPDGDETDVEEIDEHRDYPHPAPIHKDGNESWILPEDDE